MIKVLALVAILCGCLFVYGFLMAERLRIVTREEDRSTPFTVVVTVPNVTAAHRWLSVFGCSAEIVESVVHCDGYWERQSTQEMRIDQGQYVFPWRGTPRRATLQITAMTFDGNNKALGRGQTMVLR